ncbi:MAG: phosphatase PAP2 family protein [Gemmatimonadaceae bacterium]
MALCSALGVRSAVAQSGNAASTLVPPPPPEVQWYSLGEYGTFGYTRPKFLQSIRNAPGTIVGTVEFAADRGRLGQWAMLIGSTAATIAADEWLLDQSRRVAHAVDLPRNHPSVNVRVGSLKIVPLPTTLGSALYFLGDGAVSLGVAGGFFVYGAAQQDNRAFRTASQITESLLAAGTFTQILKHVTGRQTPSEATEPRGRWNWFPSLGDYNANVPGHDAFPSGHLAVALATVEVVAMNYPEKRFVRPVGYSLLTLLSFAMMNNGVHWASDYPLAIALGRTVAGVAVERGRTVGGGTGPRAAGLQPLVAPGRIGVLIPLGR